ncbi:MAG: hypothetical protein KY476_06530 [Planctomycetes bacterium]|nr:hypothetical protein [Planctomycetota bacterium]
MDRTESLVVRPAEAGHYEHGRCAPPRAGESGRQRGEARVAEKARRVPRLFVALLQVRVRRM